MKSFQKILGLTILSILLAACGGTNDTSNDDAIENDDTQSTTEETESDTETTKEDTESDASKDENNQNEASDTDEVAKMESLPYQDFELNVEYAQQKEYEAELELKQNGEVKAEIEDDIKGVDVKGPSAFDQLYPLVEKLTIDQDTVKADAIEEVIDVFDLDSEYVKIEIEITFKDGTQIEFEEKK